MSDECQEYVCPYNYQIGDYYYGDAYRKKHKRKLIEVDGWIFRFDDGHWCTDCVFADYMNCRTGIIVSEDIQIKLFN